MIPSKDQIIRQINLAIRQFENKNDLDAFSNLETAYIILGLFKQTVQNKSNAVCTIDPYLEEKLEISLFLSAYKGIWFAYSIKQFELMEYFTFVAIKFAKKYSDLIRLAKAYNGNALALHSLGNRDKASEYNLKSRAVYNQLLSPDSIQKLSKKQIKDIVQSKIKNDFGLVVYFALQNQFDKALGIVDSTKDLAIKYSLILEKGLAYKIKGNLFVYFRKYEQAFQFLFEAVDIFANSKNKSAYKSLIDVYLLICETYYKIGDFEKGKKYLVNITKLTDNSDSNLSYLFFYLEAQYHQYINNLKLATTYFVKAAQVLDKVKHSIFSEVNIDSFLSYKDKEIIYFKAIDGLVEGNDLIQASSLLENFRNRIYALEQKATHNALNLKIQSYLFLEERQQILAKLDPIQSNPSTASDPTLERLLKTLYLIDEKISLVAKKDSLQKESVSKEFDIKEWLNKIPPDTLVIAYFYYQDSDFHIFIAKNNTLEVTSISISFDIDVLISKYLKIVSIHSNNSYIEEAVYKKRLSDFLLKPLKPYLKNAKDVIVVPFKSLHSLPIHALFWEHYDNITLSYLPNLTAINNFNEQFDLADKALFVGDPRNDLPASRQEVKSISRLFPSKEILLGEEVTKEKFKQLIQKFDIVHYSGHIYFDSIYPLNSCLYLAIPNDRNDSKDYNLEGYSVFYLKEIFNLNLNNIKFLALAGCSSGKARYYRGEGLIGLLNGFFISGVKSILYTFWDVEDSVSKEFLEKFFTETMNNNGNKKIGMLNAYKYIKSRYKKTYFYAGFGLYEGCFKR